VKLRFVAAGAAVAALAGATVPLALSPSASATSTTPTVAIKRCAPVPAVIGHNVTIHGTDLAGATLVKIGDHVVTSKVVSNTASAIKVPVPGDISVTNPVPVKVTTPNGTANATCTFKKAKKKSHHS
jgi:hypothetical protein